MWQELFVLVYRYLRGRGLSHVDAEDLAQDTLLVTYRHLDGIQPGKLHQWVRAVARNRHVDWARRHSRTILVAEEPEAMDVWEDLALAGDRVDMQHLLASLPAADRRLIELKYFQDRTVEEVAEALSQSVNTTKVGLFRARKRLRDRIEKGRSQDGRRDDP